MKAAFRGPVLEHCERLWQRNVYRRTIQYFKNDSLRSVMYDCKVGRSTIGKDSTSAVPLTEMHRVHFLGQNRKSWGHNSHGWTIESFCIVGSFLSIVPENWREKYESGKVCGPFIHQVSFNSNSLVFIFYSGRGVLSNFEPH